MKTLGTIERTLQKKTILFVEVLWKHYKTANATWEPEQVMREKYPALFSEGT